MKKIILNNGEFPKIDKDELKKNNHAKALIELDELKQFYDVSVKNLPFTRIELNDLPKIKYFETNLYEKRSTRHFGQRKLLLSELEFLTLMYHRYNLLDKDKVILLYIGAAPGYHIPFLINLFPNLYMHLYDPANFSIKDLTRIKIIQDFFMNNDVKKYKLKAQKHPLLFVSDIRDPNYDNSKYDQIEKDMKLQEQWAIDIKPLGAMFKFRLSFEPGNLEYLYGNSYLPVWGPLTTTETRLICNKDDTNNWTKKKIYDNTDHEQRMFYFNNCYRMNLFKHNIKDDKVPGICHCFDCTSEIYIINNYIGLFKKQNEILTSDIAKLMNEITNIIHKDLNTPNYDVDKRKNNMNNRFKKSKPLNKEHYNEYLNKHLNK